MYRTIFLDASSSHGFNIYWKKCLLLCVYVVGIEFLRTCSNRSAKLQWQAESIATSSWNIRPSILGDGQSLRHCTLTVERRTFPRWPGSSLGGKNLFSLHLKEKNIWERNASFNVQITKTGGRWVWCQCVGDQGRRTTTSAQYGRQEDTASKEVTYS